MQKVFSILFLLALLAVHGLKGQCKDNRWEVLDVNQVAARYNNGAHKFWNMVNTSGYEVPRGSGQNVGAISALWVGGLDPQGQLHVAGSTYQQYGIDWYAGPMRTPPSDCHNEITTTGVIMLRGIKRLSNGDLLILSKNEITIYDPLTGGTQVRPLPAPRQWIDALELPDGRIFLFGDNTYPTKNPVLFMDTVTYTITGGPTLNWFHQESSVDLLDDGRVLIAGVVGCEVYDPQTNLSTVVPDMIWPRTKHATAHLPNGDILIIGGGQGLGGSGSTLYTQKFDDTLGYWFPGPNLGIGRQRAVATTMPDGKIFISGGTESSTATQIYDPVLDTLYLAAPLPMAMNMHQVSVYDSTSVIVTGIVTGVCGLYHFDIYTGEYDEIQLQRSGATHYLLNPDEVLLEVNDTKHMERFSLSTHEQAQSRWQYVWKVARAEIDAFRADFQSGQVDFMRYPHIETWPAHGDEGLGEDRNLAPFVDVNGDGRYEPALDGDYPCIVGDAALWWVYNDAGPHTESGGQQLGVQVEAMAYAFDCNQSPCPDSSLDYATFIHYELSNHSATPYHDMYMGEFDDVDIGNFVDDYFASDSSLRLAMGFNGSDNDLLMGLHPPAWGAATLPNGHLDMGTAMSIGILGPFNGMPYVPPAFYNYMQGRFLDSLPMVNNGLNGYPGTAPGPRTHYMYSSTDGFCGGPLTGWSEIGAGNLPDARRFIFSTAPFDLQPGESTQWDIAYVYARDSSNLASVCALKAATATIRDWWQNQLDRACFSTVVATHPPKPAQTLQIVPNPVGGSAFAVEFGGMLEDDGQLELMDLRGRVLQQAELLAGAERHVVDATRLPAGVYIVRVTQPSGARVQRVVVW